MLRAVLFAALLGAAAPALACGYCVEDKIASAYDHALVSRALEQKHHVAFFHIEGLEPPRHETARVFERAAYAVPGVDAGSVRFVNDTMTLAVAFDPRRVSLVDLNARLDRRLAARKLSLLILRVVEAPGDLKTVRR